MSIEQGPARESWSVTLGESKSISQNPLPKINIAAVAPKQKTMKIECFL